MNTRTWIVGLICSLSLLLPLASAKAQVTYPPRPNEGEFVVDAASLIQPEDKVKIRASCDSLLDSKGVALLVVTINSMSEDGASGWPIERYAMNLFDEWGIGHGNGRNTGVLLLVSKGDRKVRIEMGALWSHDRDAAAASVINNTIVPRFKAGQFSEGIREGVDSFAKQLGSPPVPRGQSAAAGATDGSVPPQQAFTQTPLHSRGMSGLLGPMACIVIPIVLIVIVSIVSRIGRGFGGGMGGMGPGYGGGYGPYGWGGGWGGGGGGFLSGAMLGGLLGNAWGSRHSGSSGGYSNGGASSGFGSGSFGGGGGGGGGSFGGGFSGGGGATGSW